MVERKAGEGDSVFNGELVKPEVVSMNLLGNQLGKRFLQRQFSHAALDGNFQNTCDADEFFVFVNFNHRATFNTQRRITGDEPKKGVGVEEQLHSM